MHVDRAHGRLHPRGGGCAARQADAVRRRGPARPRRPGAGRAARVGPRPGARRAAGGLRGRHVSGERRHLRGARRASAWVWSRRPAPTSTTTSTTWCCASPTRRARARAWRRSACARRQTTGSRSATSGCALEPERRAETERPLLNHIALLVDSGQEHLDEARDRGHRGRRGPRRGEHVRVLRVGAGRHQARVRRAQARVLADLDLADAGPDRGGRRHGRPGRRRAGRASCGARRRAAREGRPRGRLDAAVQRGDLAPPRLRALPRPNARPATRRSSAPCSTASTPTSPGSSRSARRPLARDTGNPLTDRGAVRHPAADRRAGVARRAARSAWASRSPKRPPACPVVLATGGFQADRDLVARARDPARRTS